MDIQIKYFGYPGATAEYVALNTEDSSRHLVLQTDGSQGNVGIGPCLYNVKFYPEWILVQIRRKRIYIIKRSILVISG